MKTITNLGRYPGVRLAPGALLLWGAVAYAQDNYEIQV